MCLPVVVVIVIIIVIAVVVVIAIATIIMGRGIMTLFFFFFTHRVRQPLARQIPAHKWVQPVPDILAKDLSEVAHRTPTVKLSRVSTLQSRPIVDQQLSMYPAHHKCCHAH